MIEEYNLVFWEEAEEDYLDAFSWYTSRREDLGTSFEQEMDKSIGRIKSQPNQFPKVYKEVYRALIKRFPYAVFFKKYETEIIIIAISHTAQDPDKLEKRLKRE